MAKRITIELEGLEDVVRKLQKRGLDVQAGLETVCNAGADVVLAEARLRAPGSIARTLDKATTGRTANRVEVSVGPKRNRHIARFYEYGTAPHEIMGKRLRGRKRGKWAVAVPGFGVFRRVRHPGQKGRPFLRPAYFSKRVQAQAAMQAKLKQVLRA